MAMTAGTRVVPPTAMTHNPSARTTNVNSGHGVSVVSNLSSSTTSNDDNLIFTTSRGGDDLASTDEVRVFDDEDEKEGSTESSSENLREDKADLVVEGEKQSSLWKPYEGLSFSLPGPSMLFHSQYPTSLHPLMHPSQHGLLSSHAVTTNPFLFSPTNLYGPTNCATHQLLQAAAAATGRFSPYIHPLLSASAASALSPTAHFTSANFGPTNSHHGHHPSASSIAAAAAANGINCAAAAALSVRVSSASMGSTYSTASGPPSFSSGNSSQASHRNINSMNSCSAPATLSGTGAHHNSSQGGMLIAAVAAAIAGDSAQPPQAHVPTRSMPSTATSPHCMSIAKTHSIHSSHSGAPSAPGLIVASASGAARLSPDGASTHFHSPHQGLSRPLHHHAHHSLMGSGLSNHTCHPAHYPTLIAGQPSTQSTNHQHNNNHHHHQASETLRRPHIKKPLNAFMLFMKEMRSKVVSECTLKESAAINQILGRKWHSLSREEQSKYYEMARKEKELHHQLYPGWSARDNYACHAKRKKKRKMLTGVSGEDPDGKSGLCPSAKKCRAIYGLDRQEQWCKPCRRKKKCIKFLSDSEDGGVANNSSTSAFKGLNSALYTKKLSLAAKSTLNTKLSSDDACINLKEEDEYDEFDLEELEDDENEYEDDMDEEEAMREDADAAASRAAAGHSPTSTVALVNANALKQQQQLAARLSLGLGNLQRLQKQSQRRMTLPPPKLEPI